MTLRDEAAKLAQPVRAAVVLALCGALLGVAVAAAPLALQPDTARGWLLALSEGPGLSHALVASREHAEDVVRAGWESPLVAARWPADGGVPRLRWPLFAVACGWGVTLGLLAALLWQVPASRWSVAGGFAGGALAGLLLGAALGAASGTTAPWLARSLDGFPGVESRDQADTFAGRVVARRTEVRAGPRVLVSLATAQGGAASPTVVAQIRRGGVVLLALLGGLAGVGAGLVAAGWRRRSRVVAVAPLAIGFGLLAWVALPFATGLDARALLLPALVVAGALAALPFVGLNVALSRRRARLAREAEERRREDELARKEEASRPIEILPDERLS